MFDDESNFENITLRRIEQLVKSYMGNAGILSHEQALVEGEEVNILELWRSLKNLLSNMIAKGCEMLFLKRLRRLVRISGESDLGLIHRAQMIY